jgi:hypothetical protein
MIVAAKGDLERVAVAVQVTALALVVGNAVACVELQAAGDKHRLGPENGGAIIAPPARRPGGGANTGEFPPPALPEPPATVGQPYTATPAQRGRKPHAVDLSFVTVPGTAFA